MSQKSISFEKFSGGIPVNINGQATEFWVCYCKSYHVRAFHVTWFTFWLCFFGWFATANLYTFIENDIGLTTFDKGMAGGCSVASTVIFRVLIGKYCDSFGARRMYPIILLIGAISLMCTAIIQDNIGYIVSHFFIGITGAGFVVTQYHTTKMFAGAIVGTANATSTGWGNFGGGCANALMPILLYFIRDTFNVSENVAWRLTMLVPGVLMILMAFVYYFGTYDEPVLPPSIDDNNNNNNTQRTTTASTESEGQEHIQVAIEHNQAEQIDTDTTGNINKKESGANNLHTTLTLTDMNAGPGEQTDKIKDSTEKEQSLFMEAASDVRTWILFCIYGGCFGMEITFLRFGSQYLIHVFNVSATQAGFIVLGFSVMNIFARPLGGITGDYCSSKYGLKGRVYPLCLALIIESILLVCLAFGDFNIWYTITFIILFSICVQCAEGVTFALVPFINPKAIGSVGGIVGAGGNFTALVLAWGLFTSVPNYFSYQTAWIICSVFVFISGFLALMINFTDDEIEQSMSTMHAIDMKEISRILSQSKLDMNAVSSSGSDDLAATIDIVAGICDHETADHETAVNSTTKQASQSPISSSDHGINLDFALKNFETKIKTANTVIIGDNGREIGGHHGGSSSSSSSSDNESGTETVDTKDILYGGSGSDQDTDKE